MTRRRLTSLKTGAILFISLIVAACGPHIVQVDRLLEFPRPIIETFPADIALHYPEEFRQFVHIEERPGARGGDWEITLGPPQVQVFDMIFSNMFRSAVHSDSGEIQADSPAYALFVPHVDDFQFALPVDTSVKVFEIWVKYSVAVIDRAGNEVMRWPFTAYGKTPTAFMKSSNEAINAAAMIALRDAGASLISGFERDRKLKEWLRQQSAAEAPAATALVKASKDSNDIDTKSVEDQQ